MRLEWSPLAMDDRERIFDFIEQDDPRAAIAVDERIATQVLLLMQFPEGGRPGRIEGTRELVIRRTPYIVAYRIERDGVRILRVLHSAQMWPGGMTDLL
ncbi:addiction module toxin RelE [Variovorax paradoxus]|uniref:type II toxin-antitoxin system RelE/ParE family toxin n=1 Tax=Variovorax TaxID=34072 RepID=UPI0006E5753A|nr:type II toxin-antitoxin system mRNA interferase toxin, RelE/StbE family [Variovorax sp.]KPV00047.1 addiction module toxin RelE [Variovorax paradoxus]KPV09210.1 addiction module toxin RelE [Variovorax paradoxus]KPV13997.1 addiction module toxin RelE [Variovorax paradoxus]KPV17539.1 addiction module toxin RelE [Variovorax paradoxus]KPV28883.1 addiction module toxin RelE [Variovorax paradoxus]